MRGQEIIEEFQNKVKKINPALMDKIQVAATDAQLKMFDLHNRSLGCFCECAGLQSLKDVKIEEFENAMIKWGLMNDEGNLLI